MTVSTTPNDTAKHIYAVAMMNSDRPTGNHSALSSGLVVLLLVLIIMAATGKSFATAPGGSVLHTTIFAVVAAVACILGLIASVRGPGSRASRMVHGIGCVVLAGGVVSFLAFTDPTTINVFGLCAVIVGFIAMLVGTVMIRSTRH